MSVKSITFDNVLPDTNSTTFFSVSNDNKGELNGVNKVAASINSNSAFEIKFLI